jgi:hypothetical protein
MGPIGRSQKLYRESNVEKDKDMAVKNPKELIVLL